MKKINSVILAICIAFISCNNKNKSAEWVESTPQSKWQTKEVIIKNSSEIPDSAIIIYPDKKQQTVEGFGGCFNELGWEALNLLNKELASNGQEKTLFRWSARNILMLS